MIRPADSGLSRSTQHDGVVGVTKERLGQGQKEGDVRRRSRWILVLVLPTSSLCN